MAKRGQLTTKVKKEAQRLLGKEITVRELRLMPYVQSVMINDQRIDLRKINEEERAILSDWRERGWIGGGAAGMTISKAFWKAIHTLLLIAYVDYENQPAD
ncbi:hypothetical protein [Pseudomonas aeruginosa]|uniref:hypothetical protein n=1 Tax=Pseudomonas aeruginosa TaxID=287 RepID=UPI001573F001|nr:hypothetical protein [Pseudomonas aeruginosa]NTU04913.1 hypothetical protein [Pseudomonas aeruginosa]NTU07305.1 hypothetical protein [Pseudomonas aeruginosa]